MLFRSGFGLSCNTVLGLGSSIDQIEEMSKARVNIVLKPQGLVAAQYLKNKYGIPYVYGVPYGYKGTLKWLNEIESITHIKLDDGVLKEIKAKENNLMIFKMQGRMGARFTHQPKVVIFSDYEKVMGIKNLCEEFGVNSCHLISAHSLKNITTIIACSLFLIFCLWCKSGDYKFGYCCLKLYIISQC